MTVFFSIIIVALVASVIAIVAAVVLMGKNARKPAPKRQSQRPLNWFEEQETTYSKKSHVYMSADMLDINIRIHSNQAQPVTIHDVYDIVDQIYDCVHENFFVLDDGNQIIQFLNDGKSEDILLEVPDVPRGGNHRKVLHDTYIVKKIVEDYFLGADIAQKYNLDFEQY